MTREYELVENAAGRLVPTVVNGKEQVPYKGVGKHRPEGRKAAPPIASAADYPAGGNKVVKDLRTALEAESLYRQLREDFPDVRLTDDGLWHRIRLGPFNKRKHAERMQRRLTQRGIDAFIIQI